MDWESFTFGAFIAVAVVSGLTALVFAAIMRRQFLLWAAARVAAIGALAMTFIPDGVSWFGSAEGMLVVRTVALDLSLAAIGPLLATYIEDDIELPGVRRALWLFLPVGLALTALAPTIAYEGRLDWLHDTVITIALVVLVISLTKAIRRGSRAASYQALAWAPALAIAFVALFHELVLGTSTPGFPLLLMMALAVDFLASAAGVGQGFMTIQRERDIAVANMMRAHKAGAIDPLTAVANRRGLEQQFGSTVTRRPSGLAVIDCDHFKRINDTFGHSVGDDVLVAVADALRGIELFPARLGGEEFVLLGYGENWRSDLERARQRIPVQVAEAVPELPFEVTASSGVTSLAADEDMETAIKRADRALYVAKDSGRNCSVSSSHLSDPALNNRQSVFNLV